MAEVQTQQIITIHAETVGDVAKWLATVENFAMTTPLTDPVTLQITVAPRT